MSAPAGRSAPSREALRSEHDALAERLAVRRSIDGVRRFAVLGFAGVVTAGVAAKLGWDRWISERATRWVGPPVFFFLAAALAAALLAVAIASMVRARRLMREEDALFARMRALRAELELDP